MKNRGGLVLSYEYLEKILGLVPNSIRYVKVLHLQEALQIVHDGGDKAYETQELEYIMFDTLHTQMPEGETDER